jgi:hypothetical protein
MPPRKHPTTVEIKPTAKLRRSSGFFEWPPTWMSAAHPALDGQKPNYLAGAPGCRGHQFVQQQHPGGHQAPSGAATAEVR